MRGWQGANAKADLRKGSAEIPRGKDWKDLGLGCENAGAGCQGGSLALPGPVLFWTWGFSFGSAEVRPCCKKPSTPRSQGFDSRKPFSTYAKYPWGGEFHPASALRSDAVREPATPRDADCSGS